MRRKRKIKMRKSTKYTILLVFFLLFIFFAQLLYNSCCNKHSKQTKEIFSYSDDFSYQYKVNLIENEYMTQEDLKNISKYYITDLINNIELELKYSYSGSDVTKFDTSYRILGELRGYYSGEQEEQEIWNKKYTLKDYQYLNNTSDKLVINENINLNLSDLNNLVKNFEHMMNISIDARYVVTLEIVNSFEIEGVKKENKFSPQISINLGEKTTTINGQNSKETDYITKEYEEKDEINLILVLLAILGMIVSIVIFFKVIKTDTRVNLINQYRKQLNQILKLCDEKIVELSKKPVFDEDKVVDVKDFEEIIKVSEELFKPILFWDDLIEERAYFAVMTNNIQYRYILKNKS